MMFDAVVVGAGVNGLVCAHELARSGRKVLVVERAARVGGTHATTEIAPGFRADIGRHDVGWVPHAIARRMRLAEHGFRVAPGSAAAVVVERGRPPIRLGDVAATVDSLRARGSTRDAGKYPEFAARMRPLARFLESMYTRPAPSPKGGTLADLMALAAAGGKLRIAGATAVVDLLRTLPMPVADLTGDWFEDGLLASGIAMSGIAGLHHGPRATGTAFLMLHREVGAPDGTFGARPAAVGGSGALSLACERAVRAAGVEIRLDAPVRHIVIERERVAGVQLESGETVAAGTVLSAVDPKRTLLQLVDPYWLPPEFLEAVSHIRHRAVVAVVRLALAEAPTLAGADASSAPLAGALRIGGSMADLDRAADAAKYGEISPAPLIELRVPSVHDPSLAPAGRHVATAHVQYAPYRLRGGWTPARRNALGDAVLQRLGEHLPNLPGAVLHREVLTPVELEQRLGISEGDMDHGAIMLDQMLFMRPVAGFSRYRMPVAGLYLCSAGTHPGGGIPAVSGWLAARAALASS